MENNIKGYLYEEQIKNYIINDLNKPAYLWSFTPENILIKNSIYGSHNDARIKRKELKNNNTNKLIDIGVDIIQVDDEKISFVQCKNGYKNGVTIDDLAGFSIMTLTHQTNINKGYVYYTDKLSNNLLSLPKTDLIEYVKQPFINESITQDTKIEFYPYQYQLDASTAFSNYYDEHDKGILSLPCGCGKTFTSFLISNKYKQVIIISPLRQFAKQNLDRYLEYGYKYNSLLINSDGTRDITEIKKFIKSNENFLISSTFCSVDIIHKCLKYMKNPFIIIDEFHNLSKNNIIDDTDDFCCILNSPNKFLFMSATPRIYEFENSDDDYEINTVYNMTFNVAIENKFITDYCIWLPSIHEDNSDLIDELSIYNINDKIKAKCMFLFSCLINNGSSKCIIYCIDTEEIKLFIDAFKLLEEFFILDCELSKITAKTSYTKRIEILNNFTNNSKRQLLFSVRILDECIDIPSCDSIFITYPSKSKIRTIQRMCRAIRINKNNKFKIANIFIWCDEYSEILDTLSGIKEYDVLFKDKIKINQIGFTKDISSNKNNNRIEQDIQLISNYLVGIKEFKACSWTKKLNLVKQYIDANKKPPSTHDKNVEVKQLGSWIGTQKKNYNSEIKKCKQIMKDTNIHSLWTKFITDYKEYVDIDLNEVWKSKLNLVKQYIDINKKRPSQHDKKVDIKQLGSWICTQKQNYNINIKECKNIMKDKEIYDTWTKFIIDYKEYVDVDLIEVWIEVWKNKLNLLKQYIDINKKSPSYSDKNVDIKQLGSWICTQKQNYKECNQIMKNKEIYDEWKQFITDYKEYVGEADELWKSKLYLVKQYIDDNKKRPSDSDKNINIQQLGSWICNQKQNYNSDIKECKNIMKDKEIYDEWTKFIIDYKEYIDVDLTELWKSKLNLVKEYIDINKKSPSTTDKNADIKQLGMWICTQKANYNSNIKECKNIMKDKEIYDEWTKFITDYKEYVGDSNELWKIKLYLVKQYIDVNKKSPSNSDKNVDVKKLGKWIGTQKQNYKERKQIMKDIEIYDTWTKFIIDYKEYVDVDLIEIWKSKLYLVKQYIDINKKSPSTHDKNADIKQLGYWISDQKQNYKECKERIKDKEIHELWTKFIIDYKEYVDVDLTEVWKNKLNLVKQYIDDNKKSPSSTDKNVDIKQLGIWISNQKKNYKKCKKRIKDKEIHELWTKFITDYKQYICKEKSVEITV
jgi:superfamily II DNA or RNA helicase